MKDSVRAEIDRIKEALQIEENLLNATRDSHKIKREAQVALLLDTHKEQIDTSRGTLQAEIEELLKS